MSEQHRARRETSRSSVSAPAAERTGCFAGGTRRQRARGPQPSPCQLRGISLAAALTIGAGLAWPSGANAQDFVRPSTKTWPLSVQIAGVKRCGGTCPDDGDVYVRIYIDGQGGSKRHVDYGRRGPTGCVAACGSLGDDICVELNDDDGDITETQSSTQQCSGPIHVRIEQWEEDATVWNSEDNFCGAWDFEVDPSTFVGSPLPQCATGGNDGGVCWLTTLGDPEEVVLPDADGDGLPDEWELNGYDRDCNGLYEWGPDVILPQLGVNPDTKDLLVELDWFENWAPSAAAVDAVRQMFARAPEDAGGVVAPGGGGIRIVFDAGTAVDASGARIGDELEHYYGGYVVGPDYESPRTDEEVKTLAADVVDPPQVGLYRTIVFGPEYLVAGGHTMGDFIYLDRTDAMGIAHELGHSLGLGHGGDEHWNCKPNHYSIMNYTYAAAGGLPYLDAGVQRHFLDFSPAWIPDTTLSQNVRMPLMPDLIETNTDEDDWRLETLPNFLPRQEIIYTNKNFVPVTTEVGGPSFSFVDWNDNGNQDRDGHSTENVDQGSLDDVNLDAFAPNATAGYSGILPCYDDYLNKSMTDAPLRHVDEWSLIVMPPHAAPGDPLYIGPLEHDPLPSAVETTELADFTTRADLSLSGLFDTSPPQVNQPFTALLTVANEGPSLAHEAGLRVTLPVGVELLGASVDCVESSPRVFDCALYAVSQLAEWEIFFDLVAAPNATLGSRELTAQLSHAGGDPDPSNNALSLPIELIPAFASFEDPTDPWVRSWTAPPQGATLADQGSDGAHSLSLSCGYASYDSPTFDTTEWEVIGTELWVDVLVPLAQSNPYWVGDLQLFFDLPAAGFYNLAMGQVGLTSLARGAWTTVSFAVPAAVEEALLGDFPDARLRLAGNVGSCLAPVLVDHLRFGGGLTPRSQYHGDPLVVNVIGPLSFDSAAEWSSTQVTLSSDPALRSEGAASLAFAPAAWTELTSRPFTAAEASAATSLLHLDVHVPDLPPDPYWVGAVQLYLECPSLNLYNQYAGQENLYPSFDDEFNSLRFELPSHLLAALHGGASDCRVKFAVSMNPAWGELHLDRGGFVAP